MSGIFYLFKFYYKKEAFLVKTKKAYNFEIYSLINIHLIMNTT